MSAACDTLIKELKSYKPTADDCGTSSEEKELCSWLYRNGKMPSEIQSMLDSLKKEKCDTGEILAVIKSVSKAKADKCGYECSEAKKSNKTLIKSNKTLSKSNKTLSNSAKCDTVIGLMNTQAISSVSHLLPSDDKCGTKSEQKKRCSWIYGDGKATPFIQRMIDGANKENNGWCAEGKIVALVKNIFKDMMDKCDVTCPEAKKSNKTLIIILSITGGVIVLAAIVAVVIVVMKRRSTVVQSF